MWPWILFGIAIAVVVGCCIANKIMNDLENEDVPSISAESMEREEHYVQEPQPRRGLGFSGNWPPGGWLGPRDGGEHNLKGRNPPPC